MSQSPNSAAALLGERGPFSTRIEGYQIRESQIALAEAIQQCIQDGSVLTAEAGTGIGKTFAYLIPALLSGRKVVVSTGTRHLQDQLYQTDLPRVVSALEIECKTALLKGRSNYLCLHRLNIAPHSGYINRDARSVLTEIEAWSKLTHAGDIAELGHIEEDSYVWPMVTSTADNCLGGDCEYWSDCFLVKARKQAQDADLLVINHHLLLADMALKQDGFAELLPDADVFIVDEAHQIHDVASRFFGESISSRQLISLVNDVVAEQVSDAPDMAELRDYADELEKAVRDFRIALGESGKRDAWITMASDAGVQAMMGKLHTALNDLLSGLQLAAERSRGLEQCYDRCQHYMQQLKYFESSATGNLSENAQDSDEEQRIETAASAQKILWYETYTRSFILHATPIDIASLFQAHTDNFDKTWIFTSATLQVNQSFQHFSNNIGLDTESEQVNSGVWKSPFDYPKQSLLYLPADLPAPSDPRYTDCFVETAMPVIEASHGHAFVLFTSYRAMHIARDLLDSRLSFPILQQGDLPKHQLLEKFKETPNAVLLGTASFWEGVDVRGAALSCVIIDKLPFASPGDPVIQAKLDAIKQQGGHPFMQYQVPQAVIALKQGVGRLIRDVNDFGVVMLGDPRIRQKGYGRIFLKSLPSMPITREISEVQNFFKRRQGDTKIAS